MSTHFASRRRAARGAFARGLAAGIALATAATGAQATGYVVTSLADAALGSTDCAVGHACNLRDAVDLANRGSGDTVTFQAGLSGTIDLAFGEIAITSGMSVSGPGADRLGIDGHGQRIFNIALPAGTDPALNPVSLSGLRFSGGTTRDNGGAVLVSDANLTLADCSFSNNRAGFGSNAVGSGGAIYAAPASAVAMSLTLRRCRFDSNSASYDGGAIAAAGLAAVTLQDDALDGNNRSVHAGGGAYVQADAIVVSGGRVANNTCGKAGPPPTPCAAGGGGLALEGTRSSSTLSVSDLRVEANSSLSTGGGGGGLMLHQLGTATLERVQISGNVSGAAGGGIQAHSVVLALRNSTLAGNQAFAGAGGGFALASAGSASLDHVSLVGNDASGGGGGLAVGSGTSAAVRNSILAFNTAAGVDNDAAGSFGLDYSLLRTPAGASTSGGNNLAAGLDPQLGALGMNGGPTLSLLPTAASPVLDQGDPAGSAGSDQRGLPRIAGGRTDLGAVERQSPEDIIFRNGLN